MSDSDFKKTVIESFDEILKEMEVFGLDTKSIDWKAKFLKKVANK